MSLLDKYRIDFEYNETYPEIQKAIRRARNAARKRKQALDANRDKRKLPVKLKLHTKRAGRNNPNQGVTQKKT